MVQAIEAVCRAGQIAPLEPVQFEENEQLVIVRMQAAVATAPAPSQKAADWEDFVGVLKDSPHWNGDPQAVQDALRYPSPVQSSPAQR